MQIYLPIAEISVNVFAVLGLGGVAGLMSGLFGVGGGFLLTPLLIFLGVSPAIAASSSANQIIASSFTGFLTHFRRGNVDLAMGGVMLVGGMVGSTGGVFLFHLLRQVGQIDLIITLCYVVFLTLIGVMMVLESWRSMQGKPMRLRRDDSLRAWLADRLPWQVYFKSIDRQVSLILPLAIGAFVGILVSLMGLGGGFFLVPAMLYLLRMPAGVVVGTSLFQMIFITMNVTLLQAISNHTVDMLLALVLLCGAVIGTQAGTRLATRLPVLHMRLGLAILVLFVALRLAYGLFATPSELYSLSVTG